MDESSRKPQELWASEGWQQQVLTWAQVQVDAPLRGEIKPFRIMPWSATFELPTESGRLWLKACGDTTAFEVPLYELLRRLTPEWVLEPLAMDRGRAWIVLPDAGEPVEETLDEDQIADYFARFVPEYAAFQRAFAPHVEELLAIGIEDMRAECIPERFEQALEICRPIVTAYGDEEDAAKLSKIEAMRDEVQQHAEVLAASPISASIDHNDIHPNNVFQLREKQILLDWGDSVVAHPFASLLILIAVLRHWLEFPEGDPRIKCVVDAYLEVFTDVSPRAELEQTLKSALICARVARTHVWARAVVHATREEDLVAPWRSLNRFVEG